MVTYFHANPYADLVAYSHADLHTQRNSNLDRNVFADQHRHAYPYCDADADFQEQAWICREAEYS